jgi:hypothetical protein
LPSWCRAASARLYVQARTSAGGAISVAALDSVDLRTVGQIGWPAGAAFLGVSPAGDLVASTSGATSWWDPVTGAIVRTAGFALTSLTWSRAGRFGAGSGDAAALFHFWRETDGTELCGPPADASSAPALESLGTPGPVQEGGTATSADGGLTVTAAFVVHTHATNYDALAVTDTATGARLRQFGATIGVEPLAISRPSGDRLYTPLGPDVAVLCR